MQERCIWSEDEVVSNSTTGTANNARTSATQQSVDYVPLTPYTCRALASGEKLTRKVNSISS